MVVGHLRDMFEGVHQGALRCRQAIIVTTMFEIDDTPRATFIPSADRPDRIQAWWLQTTGLMRAMLGTLGFEVVDLVESRPTFAADGELPAERLCHALVAKRVRRPG